MNLNKVYIYLYKYVSNFISSRQTNNCKVYLRIVSRLLLRDTGNDDRNQVRTDNLEICNLGNSYILVRTPS